MPRYLVVTPERAEVVPILDYGEGPLEYGSDVVCVDAPNKLQAKVSAVKEPCFRNHVRDRRGDGLNPFAGLTAHKMEPCTHGKCPCGLCPRCDVCSDSDED